MKAVKNLIISFFATLLLPVFISDATLKFSNDPIAIAMWMIIFCLLCKSEEKDVSKRTWICSGILALFISFFTAAGWALTNFGEIHYDSAFFWISILLFSYVFCRGIQLLWNGLRYAEKELENGNRNKKRLKRVYDISDYFFSHPYLVFSIILICWIPCYLADFPGGFRYDATAEFAQLENGFRGDFPMLHSVLITRIMSIAYAITGSYNVGIAIYTVAQMIAMSLMYTHILTTFYKRNINGVLLICMLSYCALFPVVQMLAVQEVRDVLFSTLLTYTMFWFYLYSVDKKSFMSSRYKPIVLGVLLVFTIFSRNNNAGIFMLLVLIATSILMVALNRKEYFKGAIKFAGTAIIGYALIGLCLTALCQPMSRPSHNAGLSLASQTIVRTYIKNGEHWSEEEMKDFTEFIDIEGLHYAQENADTTKWRFKLNRNNVVDFVRFWLRTGLKYPGTYLDAVLANTKYMWFPNSVIDGYQKAGVESYDDYEKCYYSFGPNIEEPGVKLNLAPSLHSFYEKIGLHISFEKIPIISMLFSIGFQFWALLNLLFYLISRRASKIYLPTFIILGYMVVSAFVPLVLLRYFAAAFIAAPMITAFTLQPERAANSESISAIAM